SWRCGMRLFGQLSSALLYGSMTQSNTSSLYDLANGVSTLFGGTRAHTPHPWTTSGNVQALLGVGWKKNFRKFDFAVTGSWEGNFWWMPSLESPAYAGNSDLTLNGINIGIEFRY